MGRVDRCGLGQFGKTLRLKFDVDGGAFMRKSTAGVLSPFLQLHNERLDIDEQLGFLFLSKEYNFVRQKTWLSMSAFPGFDGFFWRMDVELWFFFFLLLFRCE